MDAYYYFGGAKRLAQGYGFSEPYLWNYLDDPAGLPHPSHLYWMPLTSILAALPMALCGAVCPDNAALFRVAQIPGVVLASLLPLISFSIALRIYARRDAQGSPEAGSPANLIQESAPLAAAWFSLFSGFYFVFWSNTDSFALYGVVGSLALFSAGRALARQSPLLFGAAGLLAGLGHLSRADGVLLLGIVLWFCLRLRPTRPTMSTSMLASEPGGWARRLWCAAAALAGYACAMLPWFARNLFATGALLAPGGSKALWLTSYNDLFNYPADLTAASYFASGWPTILSGKMEALSLNLQTALAVQGLIALAPFVTLGLWKLRREVTFQPAVLYAAGLYFAMTFVFTYPGPRGGLLHSGTALLPFYFAAAPAGLEQAVRWIAARRRGWQVAQATRVFLVGLAAICTLLTLALFWRRAVGENPRRPAWNTSDTAYEAVGAWLATEGDIDSVVMANNPPALYYFTNHPSVVVPNGGIDTVLAAAGRYGVKWVVVDANVPVGLIGLYTQADQHSCLQAAATFADAEERPVYLYELICQ
jgi:hypothetical protein